MVQEVHPSSDELEAYSLELSSDADLEKVEEHVLICERCQNELALTDQYVRTMKKARRVTAKRKAAPVNPRHRRRSGIRGDAQWS